MNTYKIIRYTALTLSLLGVLFVLMIQMMDMLVGIDYMLIVAYLIMGLIVSAVLISLILNEYNKQTKLFNQIAISACSILTVFFWYNGDGVELLISGLTSFFISIASLCVLTLISFSFGYLVAPKKQAWFIMGLGIVCFLISSGEATPLRDGKMLSAAGSKLISAALFMFYSLILIASGSMLWFSIKNRK